jgi:hypothetical protein
MLISTTYPVCRAETRYECSCGGCGKKLIRKATVEHTVNPFNVNDTGAPKTRSEVYRDAQAAADRRAEELAGSEVMCRNCEEEPMRDLLLEMAAAPDKAFPEPARMWGSPMQTLLDRGHVKHVYETCQHCGHTVYTRAYKVTQKGVERASKFKQV